MLSLSIIGIVAAIALPSLLGNVNERAFDTQKKALHTRMAQAIPLLPSVNGYGDVSGTKSSTGNNNETNPQVISADNAAESFVRDGLSKVLKITNICTMPYNAESDAAVSALKDCGLPDKIIPANGGTALTLASLTKFGGLTTNKKFTQSSGTSPYEQLDTNAAAFETVNGESIIAYYNPYCESDMAETDTYKSQPKVCANLVYDLNGVKGPNTVGKDIGFITVLYSTDPSVVSPVPSAYLGTGVSSNDQANACKEADADSKAPNKEEAISLFLNSNLLGRSGTLLSSTISPANKAYYVYFNTGDVQTTERTNDTFITYCIKR